MKQRAPDYFRFSVMRKLACIFSLASLLCCSPALADEPVDVSMVQLIATPEKYHGQVVRLIAFLRIEFEGNALYLHQEDYEHRIFRNAIWLDLTKNEILRAKTMSDHYVLAVGHFDSRLTGHKGMFSGSLGEITRLEAWPRQ
jgi:hypothetical protein